MPSSVVVASNRGPVSFGDDGAPRRGAGGLVSVLIEALRGRNATWVSAAMSDADRKHVGTLEADATGLDELNVRMIDLSPDLYDPYYNRLSNRLLWFVHHYLFDPAHSPVFGNEDNDAWEAYQAVNRRFAETIAAEADRGASILVQDYHLSLVPPALRALRPDLKIALFWHIPFAQPDYFGILPDQWTNALMEGMLAADLVGFQTARWAEAFLANCRMARGRRTTNHMVRLADRRIRVGVYPVGVDPDQLREAAEASAVVEERRALSAWAADRKIVLRVDRTELSKNILRGFYAFESLLDRRPDLRASVAHLALLSPSRHDMPEYRAYTEECLREAARINGRYPGSLRIEVADNFPRALAAYGLYDVLVVNSVFDGMNLVAYEGPILNRRDGTLVLSRNAGAWTGLGAAAWGVNPFSIDDTAGAMEAGIDASRDDRRARAAKLRRLARGRAPGRWLDLQLKDLASQQAPSTARPPAPATRR